MIDHKVIMELLSDGLPPYRGMTTIMNLLADGLWHKAAEICQVCNFIDSRSIRELAERTGAFIGGARGYKRADKATPEELEHAGKSLLSRGRKNAHRGLEHLRQAKMRRATLGPLFADARR